MWGVIYFIIQLFYRQFNPFLVTSLQFDVNNVNKSGDLDQEIAKSQ